MGSHENSHVNRKYCESEKKKKRRDLPSRLALQFTLYLHRNFCSTLSECLEQATLALDPFLCLFFCPRSCTFFCFLQLKGGPETPPLDTLLVSVYSIFHLCYLQLTIPDCRVQFRTIENVGNSLSNCTRKNTLSGSNWDI